MLQADQEPLTTHVHHCRHSSQQASFRKLRHGLAHPVSSSARIPHFLSLSRIPWFEVTGQKLPCHVHCCPTQAKPSCLLCSRPLSGEQHSHRRPPPRGTGGGAHASRACGPQVRRATLTPLMSKGGCCGEAHVKTVPRKTLKRAGGRQQCLGSRCLGFRWVLVGSRL